MKKVMSESKTDDVEECKALGNDAFASKEYETAIAHYTKGIQLDIAKSDRTDSIIHILYSNRSACQFLLERFKEASDDAKECIKINPTFIKGYYRLAQSLMGLKDWDGANNTVRQGLNLDAENAQLLRQLRTIQKEKKRLEAAARQTEAMMEAKRNRGVGEDNDEIRDLQEQYVNTNRELQMLNANVQKLQREQKLNELTMKELENLQGKENGRMYRGVGKMFMLSSESEISDHLNTEISDSKKKENDLSQKREYLVKKISSQQQNLQELLKP
mmetsp:Transcript_20017/g.25944  ORF Transcript_20017/g.25944 Transcript_20017/m.25944 type:complete len:273 (-) Transcript_20017:128-946(-)